MKFPKFVLSYPMLLAQYVCEYRHLKLQHFLSDSVWWGGGYIVLVGMSLEKSLLETKNNIKI
jgi:hypothetical protein